jgi:hypothetical protein
VKTKESEASQPSKVGWNGACEVAVGEVEDGEKREVTEMRRDLSLEGHVGQNQSRDALPAAAARNANPSAEGCIVSPAVGNDAKRVGELRFEGKESCEVHVIAS